MIPLPSLRPIRAVAVPAIAMAAGLSPAAAEAQVDVVASVAPVHSLVAGVMDGLGAPTLLVEGGGSPHAYTLRPSQARALDSADVVFWVGPILETFLTGPIGALSTDARVVALEDATGLERLPVRDDAAFEAHDHHGHDHDGHEHEGHSHGDDHDHGHADHEDGDHAGHDDHDHGDHDHGDHAGHDHGDGAVDAHFWLDPANARVWVGAVAEALTQADPANAATYADNAEALAARLDALTEEMAATLAPVGDRPFLVFHDAYQYMEARFDLSVAGAVTLNPSAPPGARRVSEIRDRLREAGAVCLFREPQFEPRLAEVVVEGTDVRAGVLDPLGADLAPGPDLYFEMMRRNAEALADCLG